MDSFRSSTSSERDFHGYRRRPHSLIEKRLGSQFETVENLLPFEQYFSWASMILKEIPRTKEMDITRAWLEFISRNRNVPVMYDFIRLFVFSLHLRYRVRPFDANPHDGFLDQPRFDVVNAGRILISRLIALEQKMKTNGELACQIQRRDRHYSKYPKPIYGKTNQPQRFFPLVQLSSNRNKNTKEYFASQGIPGFGRHCWYAVADDKYPYYYRHSSKPRNRKDILARLADHINNMEKRKKRPITDRDIERFRLTTRDWWTWHDPHHPGDSDGPVPEDTYFRWYKDSNITKKRTRKLDKKHLKKIVDDEFKEVTLGYQPIPRSVLRNVLGLDIDDSSFSNVKIPRRHSRGARFSSASAKRASIRKWLDDLDISLNQEIPETRDQHFSPGSPFQRSTPSPCQSSMQLPCEKRIAPTPCQRRTTPSPCERRTSLYDRTPSPCSRRSRTSPCPERSTPSPFPESSTPSPCLGRITRSPQPRKSTRSPCPERSTPSPCPERSIPSPCLGRVTRSPCPRKSAPSPCLGRSTPPPCPRKSSSSAFPRSSTPCPRSSTTPPCPKSSTPSPCPTRSTPVFDTESKIYSEDISFTREIAERIGDPFGPPEIVNAAIGEWLDQLESSLQDETPKKYHTRTRRSPIRSRFSSQGGVAGQSTRFGESSKYFPPSDAEEGFFRPGEVLSSESWGEPIEGDTYPDAIEPEQDFAGEMAQFEAQACAGSWKKSESSLDFENAKELSFFDQFLLPTADIQFDEKAQEAANPFGGFDESDDDWVAPPEIVPSETEQFVPLPKECAESWEKSERSLDFENAKELSFADQFLLPTADVQFDEEAQEAADPFGGFDESDDDWVAPPDIVPSETEQFVPLPKESETENRRAGKLFLPQPKKEEDTTVLERISWPNRSHLYDINTDFPETDGPFDFLDHNQLRNIEDMRGICEELHEEEDKWLNLADIADQIGQK